MGSNRIRVLADWRFNPSPPEAYWQIRISASPFSSSTQVGSLERPSKITVFLCLEHILWTRSIDSLKRQNTTTLDAVLVMSSSKASSLELFRIRESSSRFMWPETICRSFPNRAPELMTSNSYSMMAPFATSAYTFFSAKGHWMMDSVSPGMSKQSSSLTAMAMSCMILRHLSTWYAAGLRQ